eukprot:13016-Prymnesium_polylepis.1
MTATPADTAILVTDPTVSLLQLPPDVGCVYTAESVPTPRMMPPDTAILVADPTATFDQLPAPEMECA